MKKLIILLLFMLLNVFSANAQSPAPGWQHQSNFSWSLGYSAKDERLPEGYNYSPLAFFGQYRFAQFGPFDIYSEAQFARASSPTPGDGDYEFGFNLGVTYQLSLSPSMVLAAALGSGPYYITVDTRRQARGFIFSDNFEMGLTYHPPQSPTALQLRARYRHISNAGLENPNGGIDNLFVIAGVTHLF